MKKILTYGTFDVLHRGHINLLRRAKERGDYLIVGISTDEFNAIKGKKSYYDYETRKAMLEAIKYVDEVIPECEWNQKPGDIVKYGADEVVMGSDGAGNEKFEALREYCDVHYLPRTEGISSTQIKSELHLMDDKAGV